MRTARSKRREKSNSALFLVDSQTVPRTKRVKHKFPRLVKLMALGLGLYLLFLFGASGYEIWKLKRQVTDLGQEQSKIAEQQQQLQQELQSLNNPEVIEKIARESLGMVRQGETVVVPAITGYDIPKPKAIVQGEITH